MGKEELPPPLQGPEHHDQGSAGRAVGWRNVSQTPVPRKCHPAALTILTHTWRRSRERLEAFPQFRAQQVHSSTGLGTKVITQSMFPAEIMK